MKNALTLLAAVGLVVTVAVFANRPSSSDATTADPGVASPVQQTPAAQAVSSDDGCCGLEGLLGAPVAKIEPVATDLAPAAVASGDECGAACPNAMLSGTCCMELAAASAKAEAAHACCAEAGAAAASACEHAEGAACCEECVEVPQAVETVRKDQ